jgi:hypothetical protein
MKVAITTLILRTTRGSLVERVFDEIEWGKPPAGVSCGEGD